MHNKKHLKEHRTNSVNSVKSLLSVVFCCEEKFKSNIVRLTCDTFLGIVIMSNDCYLV